MYNNRVIYNSTKKKPVAALAVRADGFFSRLRGLMFKKFFPADEALAISPCSAIHTFFMRFPIDAAFVGRDGTVLRVARNIRPWRLAGPVAKARMVIEMAAGSLGEDVIVEGDVISMEAKRDDLA